MKKLFAILLAFALTVGSVGCSKSPETNEKDNTEEIKQEEKTKDEDKTQIPNPVVSYETIEDAQENLDFEIEIPDAFKDYEILGVSVIDGKLFQVTFSDNGDEILYRMAEGDEDISGDYNEYEVTNEVEVDGIEAVLKGNGDGVYVMNWCDDDYTYSISFITGVSQETAEDILRK